MTGLPIPTASIAEFCRRWKVREFGLIGSALRDDFPASSDVDVVVTFAPDAEWDLFDIVRMREDLAGIFGRDVDLIEEPAVRDPYVLASIRRTKRVLYAGAVVEGAR
jgi:predicted nucleotidyltransferase